MQLTRFAAPLLAISFALAPVSSSFAQAADANEQTAQISITGTGHVQATPDMATVTSGVVSDAKSARDALNENSKSMNAIIDKIKSAGIDAKDIQTSGFNISPNYNNSKSNYSGSASIDGYRVFNNVTVRVRDLAKLGDLLDTMVTEGANNISGINFIVSEADTLSDEARKKAVANAKRKAELYAAASGVKLGRVLSINEGGGFQPVQGRALRMEAMASSDAPPIEQGQQTLTTSVNMVWEILE
ncbi:MAG: SIMPL domain-containing protein [Stappiaceae bacterium]